MPGVPAAGRSRFPLSLFQLRSVRRLIMTGERHPWGSDPYSALRWAFNRLSSSVVLPTALGAVHHSGRPVGLSRADVHAQASMIRDVALAGAGPVHAAYLTAYFLPPPSYERLAGGGVGWVDRSIEERQAAIHQVAWWLLGASGTGGHRIRGYQEIVAQYCLGKPNHKRLKELLRVRHATAIDTKQRAFDKLDELHERSLLLAGERLARAGLIQEG